MSRPALAAAVLAVVVLVAARPAPAAARSFSIERFGAALDVRADGSVQVRETLTIDFQGAHNGVWRAIPVRYVRHGLEFALRVDEIAVLDDAYRPLRSEVSYPDRYVRIKAWVPDAVDTRKTIHVLYRVRRGLLAFDDHDELYWDVTGDEWEVPIRGVEASVALPPGLRGAVETAAYTGPRGAVGADYTAERAGDRIILRTTRPLRAGEGFTVVVGWPPGLVARPPAWRRAAWFFTDNWPLALPLLTVAAAGLLWRAYGRDPQSGRSIKPEYAPPAGLVPAEAGPLLDERAQARDVVATLLDLAVRGYVAVERPPDDPQDFAFRRIKTLDGDGALKRVETAVLKLIFGVQLTLHERRLSDLRRDYDYVFPRLRDAIDRTLVEDRLFAASPFWVRQGWLAAGFAVLVVAALLVTNLDRLGPGGWTFPLGVALSGAVLLGVAPLMPRRTWRGVGLLTHLRGFQEFLERAEKDRLERLPGDTLHRLLPWAMALGVTERWILNWKGIDVPAPTWFPSDALFTLSRFQGDLDAFARENVRALLETRAGSGRGTAGGGSSGFRGGSSGGGFGGGGGGTF